MSHNADQSSNIQQIAQATFDVALQAQKVVLEGETEIALDFSEDSVLAVGPTVSESATVTTGGTTGDIVVAAFDASKVAQLNIITNTLTNLTATTPVLTLQLSPSATDDVWVDTALTVVPSATAGTVVAGTPISTSLYKRGRVKFTFAAFTAGSFKVYVNGR